MCQSKSRVKMYDTIIKVSPACNIFHSSSIEESRKKAMKAFLWLFNRLSVNFHLWRWTRENREWRIKKKVWRNFSLFIGWVMCRNFAVFWDSLSWMLGFMSVDGVSEWERKKNTSEGKYFTSTSLLLSLPRFSLAYCQQRLGQGLNQVWTFKNSFNGDDLMTTLTLGIGVS